ncbi:Transcriptional regulator, XRE family [[Actinomadura] parvosata subsp. kistnae]|uniref:Transcriptional regulator n=1 Tax=[Actinomadura] parvosata subsp. kistnae TaxID=1909395 RepID=A0A1V0A5L9_9ACTN|nr:helix-turn-helix transcriptional regulator [Nonomuraea sp. ATCC 55076]AQZ65498.1 transcriptional regulator [Nonomuraea sp. ATCC 55076]SPL96850.1 Transcriptional regulator, XRE family [Actinomadura parvosata subsp. kistnae]
MTTFKKWDRAKHVEQAGGEEALAETRRMVDEFIDAWQLAQRRKSAALTQNEVAAMMGVTKARVSQIERGEVTSVDVVARYVEAIGGHLELTATFPGATYRLRASGMRKACKRHFKFMGSHVKSRTTDAL